VADLAALGGLFAIAFAAATILPLQSEAAMVALQLAGWQPLLLIVVASLGNTLGAVTNWFLGRGIEHLKDKSWFPASSASLDRATRWYGKWGRWSLLMAWLPIGGDALTIVAGVLREPLWSFVLLVGIGKTLRYAVLAAATAGLFGI